MILWTSIYNNFQKGRALLKNYRPFPGKILFEAFQKLFEFWIAVIGHSAVGQG